MSTHFTRRRVRRGFSLLEAMTAGVIFFIGVTGVMVFASRMSFLTRQGAMNNQLVQVARNEINRRTIAGLVGIGGTTMQTVDQLPSGLIVIRDTEIFDTSGPVGMTPVAQLPGCDNLGYPSSCVRVTAQDCMVPPVPAGPPFIPPCSADRRINRYQTAAYVTN